MLKITMAVYRVTNLFPGKEPLKYDIRAAANRILACGLAGEEIREELETLKTYFVIAKAQSWVAENNFMVLEQEYEKLSNAKPVLAEEKSATDAKNIKNQSVAAGNPKKENSNGYPSPQDRKKKIAETIHKEEKIALRDLMQNFPGVHRRTLIRDLESLVRESVVKKEGNGKRTLYLPNGHRELLVPQVYAESDDQTEMVTEV